MQRILAAGLIAVFVALSALHVFWAAGGRAGGAVAIPRQGPTRPAAAGGGAKRGDGGRDEARSAGGKSAGGDMATGAGAGMGVGLGVGIASEDDADERR